jgi:hypothetical protein
LKKKKIYREMRQLESSFNPEAFTMLQNIEQGREILLQQANIALFSRIVIDEEPSSFDEEWNHDDTKARRKWRDAIKKELNDKPLMKRGIMKIQKLEENGKMQLKRSLWISNKFGRSLRKKIFQKIEELSNVNASSR